LSTRKDEFNNSIRDLGILPEEAYTKYVDASLDKVCPSLKAPWSEGRADKIGSQETP
jgi:hypothetical protein